MLPFLHLLIQAITVEGKHFVFPTEGAVSFNISVLYHILQKPVDLKNSTLSLNTKLKGFLKHGLLIFYDSDKQCCQFFVSNFALHTHPTHTPYSYSCLFLIFKAENVAQFYIVENMWKTYNTDAKQAPR
jgi:hypothetical protein